MVFTRIILLSDELSDVEEVRDTLQRCSPTREILLIQNLGQLTRLGSRTLSCSRMVSIFNSMIVPKQTLDLIGYGGYNFHLGPPNYPGWAPPCFAVYNREKQFGVTAHVMQARVDSGPIVGVKMFDVPAAHCAAKLFKQAMAALLELFEEICPRLAGEEQPLSELPISWGTERCLRSRLHELCQISPSISQEELERRMLAFGCRVGGGTPTVRLHDYRFTHVSAGGCSSQCNAQCK